tara:strand:- start:334 stop:447 length:114 start_codon:yes stop_codon:yes gene_type:complete
LVLLVLLVLRLLLVGLEVRLLLLVLLGVVEQEVKEEI